MLLRSQKAVVKFARRRRKTIPARAEMPEKHRIFKNSVSLNQQVMLSRLVDQG